MGISQRGTQEKRTRRTYAFGCSSGKPCYSAFFAAIGTRGFLDGALSHQFYSADYSFAVAFNHRKGTGNQSWRGRFLLLFDFGGVRDRLIRFGLPRVPFESQSYHCNFQLGRWFCPLGNIPDKQFMGDAHGTLWLGFWRRPLYPFGDRDDHGVDRAAALGESHRRARAGTQPGFFLPAPLSRNYS